MKNRFNLNMHDYIHQADGKLFFNKQMFGIIAPRYDFINRALSFGRDQKWKDLLVSDLPDVARASSPCGHGQDGRAALHCLDIACGTGDITFRLAAKYPQGQITGIDITEKMLDLARSRLQSINEPAAAKRSEDGSRVTFQIGDMCKMEFEDASFDIVTGGYALRNAPNLEQALIEIRRVMKPGATAAFLDFSKPPNRTLQKTKGLLLKFWGGLWGLLLHRNPRLYTYIAESLKLYPDRIALKQLITKLGFTNIRSRKHFLGFAETISFQKP
jgi:demethylmenaquinone methyltransferase/2-methoxy-6-polyprenyl-1,4-benzoquinol methylase